MKNRISDKVRLRHILEAIEEIEDYTNEISFEEFTENSIILFASIKQLEIIGEATKNLSEDLKKKNDTIDWQTIVGLRNVLVHEYFGVDEKIIWEIIKIDLPQFHQEILQILNNI